MHVILPDGSQKELPDGASGADLAAAIGPGLARAALAVKVGGEVRDLARPLADGDEVAIVTNRDDDSLDLIRHDTAHVLAAAVLDLYPGTKISIGPPIEDGFYYDFEFPEGVTVSDADFEQLEAKMREHVKAGEPFVREDVSPAAARERFVGEGQDYKVELIDDLVANNGVDTVSLYTNGPFTDLCRGPHAPATDRIKAFKLLSVAGAYWRGDSDNTMLTRIYGTAFHSKDDLAAHLERLEQARQRDHRKLGRELGLFTLLRARPRAARSGPPPAPRSTTRSSRARARCRSRAATRRSRPRCSTTASCGRSPATGTSTARTCSSREAEDQPMALKPMNCPGHCAFYAMGKHSYRELPIRYSEPGHLHRNEPSGTLHGLLRVRHFIQDDAHIFCTEEQVEQEVLDCLEFGFAWYDQFGFDMRIELSTRPEQRIGTDEMWDRSEAALEAALEARRLRVRRSTRATARSTGRRSTSTCATRSNRSWQLGTVQLDYNFPERFDLTYTGADNAEHQPAMIHRALVGSFERFIGILLEHTGGDLPLWLAPVQAAVLPLADRHNDYAQRGRRRAARRRAARRGRRPHRVGRAQDPRGRAAQGALHARGRRPRGRGARRPRCAATARATWARCRSTRPWRGSRARSAAEAAPCSSRSRCVLALAAPAHASTAQVVTRRLLRQRRRVRQVRRPAMPCRSSTLRRPRRARPTASTVAPCGRRGDALRPRRAVIAAATSCRCRRRPHRDLHRGGRRPSRVSGVRRAARRRGRHADASPGRSVYGPRSTAGPATTRSPAATEHDTLDGGPGADRIDGGGGTTRSASPARADARDGRSRRRPHERRRPRARASSASRAARAPTVCWAARARDTLAGGPGRDDLIYAARPATDELAGDLGADTPRGRPGDDQAQRRPAAGRRLLHAAHPPAARDVLRGGSGRRRAERHRAAPTASRAARATTCSTAAAATDRLDRRARRRLLTGTAARTTSAAGGAATACAAAGGDDRLSGGDGTDALCGGTGADRLLGGPGADR